MLRLLPDDTVAETHAYPVAYLLRGPEYVGRLSDSRWVRLFIEFAYFLELTLVRRYATKLIWGFDFHKHHDPAQAATYCPAVMHYAARVEMAQEQSLLDSDDGLYAAQYVAGFLAEAGLREDLEQNDRAWYRAVSDLRGRWRGAAGDTPATTSRAPAATLL